MPRPRTAEQIAKRFLSSAFRHDTLECQQQLQRRGIGLGQPQGASTNNNNNLSPAAASAGDPNHDARAYEIQWLGIRFPDAVSPSGCSYTAVQITLFDHVAKRFFGATYRVEVDTLKTLSNAKQPAARTAVGGVQQQQSHAWMWSVPDSVLVCVELLADVGIDQPETVAAWACCPLSSIAAVTELAMHSGGSAVQLYLEKELWPQQPQTSAGSAPVAAVHFRMSEMPLGYIRFIGSLLPSGVFAPPSKLLIPATTGPADLVQPRDPVSLPPFRVLLTNFSVWAVEQAGGASTAASYFASDCDWELVVCAHSGYRCLAISKEAALTLTGTATLSFIPNPTSESVSGSLGVELQNIPTSAAVHLVVALRMRRRLRVSAAAAQTPVSLAQPQRADMTAFQTMGFAVVPLRPDRDRDVVFTGVPFVKGPFSTDDTKFTMLEVHDPYGPLPLALGLTVGFFDTPVPAKRVEEMVEPQLRRPEPHEVPAIGQGPSQTSLPTPALQSQQPPADAAQAIELPAASSLVPPATSPAVKPASLPTIPAPPSLPPAVDLPPVSSQVQQPVLPTATPIPATTSAANDIASYKLLCQIMEELDKIRVQQERLNAKMLSAPSMAIGPRQPQSDSAGAVDAAVSSGAAPYQQLDIAPRRSGIALATRCALTEGMSSILHPIHGTPLSDGMLLPNGERLPHSLVGMRVEGITVDLKSVSCPQRLVGFLSFGSLPLQALAVMYAQQVVEEDSWRSFRIASSDQASGALGFVWSEAAAKKKDRQHEALEDDALSKRFKTEGTLYLHIYDAVTMFYCFTATVSMQQFIRTPETASSIIPLDLSLFVDYSLTEKAVPESALPVVHNVGLLHVSLFCVADPHATTTGSSVDKHAGGPLRARSGNLEARSGSLVVAKKIANFDATTGVVAPTFTSAQQQQQAAATSDPRNRLHQLRAEYVKNLLSQNGGAIPGVPQHHVAARDAQEMEYRLRFVEKKRDEAKAAAIANALRQSLTQHTDVAVAVGRTEVCHINFENPYPVTSAFTVHITDQSARALRPAGAFASSFLAGPRAVVRVPLLLCVKDAPSVSGAAQGSSTSSGGSSRDAEQPCVQHYQACVKSLDGGETLLIADFHATIVTPIVHRRYEVFGAAGAEVTKRLFSRQFSSGSLPADVAITSAAASQKIAALCSYCTVSDATTVVRTSAVVDPITQSAACAWEEVTVKTLIPLNGAKSVMVDLYRDEALTQHWETWELTVFPCQVIHATSIHYGRTTSIAVPVATDRVYVDDTQVVEVVPSSGQQPTLVRVKPKDVGESKILLHSLQSHHAMQKVLLHVHVSYPTPTYQYTIEMSAADAQVPLFRRFLFVNRENQQRVFNVQHNYKSQVSITPRTFALGPGDSQHLSLEVVGLTLFDGQAEGRWPLWIFVNDQSDGTVESYLLHIIVRLHRPFF